MDITACDRLLRIQSRALRLLRVSGYHGKLCGLYASLTRVELALGSVERLFYKRLLRLLVFPVMARLLRIFRMELVLCLNNHAVGHLSLEPERAIRKNLSLPRPRRLILFLNRNASANSFLDALWRREYPFVDINSQWHAILQNISLNYSADAVTCDYFRDGLNMQREYRKALARHTAPLLHFTGADVAQGMERLRQMGIGKGEPFVCLHAREGGFKKKLKYHSYRDVDPYTYIPAIRLLLGKGIKVVRLGDPTMARLPPMEGFVDYPHSPFKSDFMDVFLCGSCAFLIGTNSGITHVATLFGVRSCHVNVVAFPFALTNDIFIPKLVCDRDGRVLSFREQRRNGAWNFVRTEEFASAGLSVRDNTPDEIAEAVEEMWERVFGSPAYTAEDMEWARKSAAIWGDEFGLDPAIGSRLGRGFARRHAAALLA